MSAYDDLIIRDAPWLYHRLGESSGTQAADLSGFGRHSAYRNPPEGIKDHWIAAKLGKYRTLAGMAPERAA